WAENCPENFESRAALVGAEIARVESRALDAERLYEQAIRSAQANGFVHNEALSNELAARFYRARGFDTIAHTYLRKARYCYLRWGANGKVQQLDELHPQLREEEGAPGSTSTIGAPVEHLDLSTVIKVSQAVSGEMVLEKLIDTLMRTAVEHAGAQRGLLILPQVNEQWIEAEATTRGDTIVVRLLEAPVADAALPASIVHFVARTHESVILDDAAVQNPFSGDAYFRQQHARSILCLPLINQRKLIGVLYLENNLATHVFTPTRIAVLKLLASQAAISLENTRLYRDLEEREAKIRRLFEANVMGIIIWNFDGDIIDANEAFLNLVKYSREDLVSRRVRWTELTPSEWRDRDEQALAELKTTRIFQPFEKEYFRKDRSRVPVMIGGAFFEGSNDEGVAFVLDLSEQKRAEEALRRSEAYLAEAQKLSHTGSFGWNVSTGKIYWSQETFRIFEYDSATEPTLDRVLDRTHPEDRALVEEVIDRVSLERKDFDVEHRLLMPDDSVKYLRVVGRPSKGDASGNFKFVGAVTDITERKLAEEAVNKAQAELAHVSRVATMGELTASIAHEVNQPLGAIINYGNAGLRFLKAGSPDLTQIGTAFSAMVADANRASAIIARIRALSKKSPPELAPLQIRDLVIDTQALVQHALTENRIVLKTTLAGDLSPVLGDRIQLQQVLLNLMVNSIDAMKKVPEGRRELSIEARSHVSEDKPFILITVTDSGIGLKAEDLPRLFETFYTTKAEGMGMGLAISRSIVEAHGGRLWATPNTEVGATFQFMLPAQGR
ncbi:MAG: PAS domain S-box protein, partial [Verrucomicrobia bacterium]|nr:PAS domain S-box protein [Verrucomicrobiota bacterium]